MTQELSASAPRVSRRTGRKPGPKSGNARPETPSAPFDARALLLQAAHDLLKERNGIEPPVLEIAERAQLNAGLISYYFGGKDGMFVALLERNLEPSIAELRSLVASANPVLDKLRANITGLINLHFRYPHLNQLLLMVVERSEPERAQQLSDRFVKPASDAIAQLLEQGRASGETREIDPMLYYYYYYTVQGACDLLFAARYSLRSVFGINDIDRDLRQRMTRHTISLLVPGLAK